MFKSFSITKYMQLCYVNKTECFLNCYAIVSKKIKEHYDSIYLHYYYKYKIK